MKKKKIFRCTHLINVIMITSHKLSRIKYFLSLDWKEQTDIVFRMFRTKELKNRGP
jgi:hypothetical protein